MPSYGQFDRLRLSRPEMYFFVILFILLPVLTDLEFSLNGEPGATLSIVGLLSRVINGFLQGVPFIIYYKTILPHLFRKRYGRFAVLLLLFLFLLDLYTKYGVYGLLMQATFLPKTMTDSARTWYHATMFLHFSVAYIIRELVVVSTLGYYFRSAQQQQQISQLQYAQLESELGHLKAQIQPHFFFNTLNNIYSLALDRSEKTAP